MRRCGTPGCCFHDHHDGPHSHERPHRRIRKSVWYTPRAPAKTIKKKAPVVKTRVRNVDNDKANDFQVGITTVRTAMERQCGVRICVPLSAFSGYWHGCPDMCHGIIVAPLYKGKYVAEALFDGDTEPTPLTSSLLMLHETRASWKKPHLHAERFHIDKCAKHVKHMNAFKRAEEMCEVLLDMGTDLAGKTIITLDGMGTSRVAINTVMDARGLPAKARPTTVTLEMNADGALGQRIGLGFGSDIKFTNGDPYVSSKVRFGGTPKLEDIVLTHNRILPDKTKRGVVGLNLDYCGGPPNNYSMQKMLTHLPALRIVTITMARRNHANLHETFDDYFPPPYGFHLRKTYTSNPRVVCKMYVRNARIVRHVIIPGSWWVNADPAWKKTVFDGIVVAKKNATFDVYVPHDGCVYPMSADALAKFAT